MLLLVNYRPEYQHAWGSKTAYSQLRLDALPAESAGELLDALLGEDPGLAPVKQLLVKRGNPFFLEETVRTLVETKAVPPSVFDRSWLAMSLAQLGRFSEAAEYEAEAIRLAEPTHHAYSVGWIHFAAGTFRLLKGEWAKARSLLEHGIGVFRTGSIVYLLPAAVASSARALAQLGEASEALNRLREGEGEPLLERQAARGLVSYLGWAYHSLGRACLLLGRLDEARRLGDRAVESSAASPGFAAHALHLLGDIATHPGRFDAERGEAHYRQALGLAEPRGMRPIVAHCHLGLGKLYGRRGKRAQAREHLATATTMYREMDMRFWLEQAEAESMELGA